MIREPPGHKGQLGQRRDLELLDLFRAGRRGTWEHIYVVLSLMAEGL